MRRYLPWLLRLLGPALLVLLLARSDLPTFVDILLGAAVWPILLSLLLFPPFLLIKTWRWQLLLHELGLTLPFWRGAALYTVGIYLGAVTPGQAGDLVKAWYLRERGQPLAPALLSVMIDRLCDLLVMAVLATLGIFALGQLLPSRALQTLVVVAMGVGLAVLTVLMVARGPRRWLLGSVLPALLPQQTHAALARWNEQFAALSLRPGLVLIVGVASLVSAAFTFWRLWLLFVALDVFLPLYVVVGASALIAILQVLPISIGGLGVRDAVLVAVLLPYGYATEQALGVSALFLLVTLQHILLGFIVSFWFPVSRALTEPTALAQHAEDTG
jgi:uncharacterized protein (TIRG00374 family)